MVFDVSTTYDRDAVKQFQEILNGTIRRRRIRTVRTIIFIVAAACFAYAVLWMVLHFVAVPVLFGFVFGVVFLILGLTYSKFTSRSGKSLVSDPPVTERYFFETGGYRNSKAGKSSLTPYSVILTICENENFYVLMIGHNRGFLLDKRHFHKGTPEAFRTFIREKTGKTIQTER